MKGWLDKYDDSIVAQGGETISSSREDYLRQQHQNYLKSQAEKGRKAVVEGREKFAKDYVIPAIKTAASFTPAGPLIGLADAYEAYQQGNTGWALAGAGMEALPYIGKGVGEGLSALTKLSKLEVLPSPVPYAHYRNIGGVEGYTDVLNRREVAPPIIPRPESTGLRSLDGRVTLPKKQFNRAYYAKKGEFSPALQYSGPYAVEAKMSLRNGFGGNWGYAPDPKVEGFVNAPLDDPRIRLLKQYRLPKTELVLLQKELPKKGKGGFISMVQEGARIKSDDRNWLERFNDRIYSGYQKNKPQLFKDFPITDIVEPIVSYLTGHADSEYGPFVAFTPSMGKMIAKPSKDFNNLYHYSRNPFLDYEDVNLFREGSSQMKGKYRRQADSPEDLPGGFYTTMNPRDRFMGGKYGNKMSIPANAKVKDLAITGRMTDRISIKELKQFRSEGYDIIKGKNMLDQEEWIPLNKNKLFGWEKFNRSDYRPVPRESFQQGGIIPKAQEGRILEREGMKESPFSFLIPEKSGKGTGRTSKYFTELSNYYKGDASYPYQYLSGSEYKPTMGNNEDVQYMSIQDEPFKQRIVEEFNKGKKKGNKVNVSYAKDLDPLGKFSIYEGKDEGGEYLSYYDKWDVNPLADMIGKPFELYDRIYVEKNAEGKYVPKKFAKGGNVSYTPGYIEQLKQFENRPDNLAYHLDSKKIPTIGWGHRITEEELKRKAIKMGKEWIPYEKFSGKEGRQYADRLMELDVAHHYNRLERQVGKDTLAILPPELHDVLLDITYNRGSLGDSLEYVKKGDIPGLKNYLAGVSKELKGGAKTRMEWRANRIPLTTPAPVQVPLYDTPQNNYVPKVLQNIVQDNEGYRNPENYGKPVQITSNQSTTPISMQGVPFPILAMSDTGELKIMMPGEEHEFEGGSVTEVPMAKKGGVYQKGGKVNSVLDEVRDAYDFIKSYHSSPKFKERYYNMYYNDDLLGPRSEDRDIQFYSDIVSKTGGSKSPYQEYLNSAITRKSETLQTINNKVNDAASLSKNKLDSLNFATLNGKKYQPFYDQIIRGMRGRPNPVTEGIGSHYDPTRNLAFIYKDDSSKEGATPAAIAAHEFSHAVSSYVPYTYDLTRKQNSYLRNTRDDHDLKFTETKSDIDALRYLLNKNKIYDARTQDFTKEHLRKAKKIIKDFSFDRLQRLYDDENLVELMNIIAANDNRKKQSTTVAKKGDIIKSKQLRTFTEDTGWLSKYKE